MKLLLDNQHCKVAYFEEFSTVILKWKENKKVVDFENYKLLFITTTDFQKTTPFDVFMSDIRLQKSVPAKFREWFQEEVLATGVKQGIKTAIIVSQINVFKKFYINHILNTSKKFGLPLKIFKNTDDAMVWIKANKN